MFIRFKFRGYFGIEISNQCGHFLDHQLCAKVHEFANWLDYPECGDFMEGPSKTPKCCVISSDGRTLFLTWDDPGLTRFNLMKNTVMDVFPDTGLVSVLACHTRGYLALAAPRDMIDLCNSKTMKKIRQISIERSGFIDTLCFNESGDILVAGTGSAMIVIMDVKNGSVLKRISEGVSSSVTSIKFLGDSIICAHSRGAPSVWDYQSGELTREIEDSKVRKSTDLSINSDRTLVACCTGQSVMLYRWPELHRVREVRPAANKCSFHPRNPKILAATTQSGAVKIYSVDKKRCLETFRSRRAKQVDFSPCGSRLIVFSWSTYAVQIYDTSPF